MSSILQVGIVAVVNIDRIAEEHELGNLVGEFRWNKSRAKLLFYVWLFLLPIIALAVFFIPLEPVELGYGIGGIALLICFYFIYRQASRLKKKKVLSVYEQGLVDQRKGKPKVIRFENVKNLWLSINQIYGRGLALYLYTLQTEDSKKHKFNNSLSSIEQLAFLFQNQVWRYQFPIAMNKFKEGEEVDFGKISLSKEGLSLKNKNLPWFELKQIDLQEGMVFILQKEEGIWAKFPASGFPNLSLFTAMTEQIKKNN
ncbi:MAG: DUF6585 family protein [Spirulinaceae cyanobacterium]